MSEPSPEEETDFEKAALLVLAEYLGHTRDVLMESAMLLRDASFDLEDEQRAFAAEQLKLALERIAAR